MQLFFGQSGGCSFWCSLNIIKTGSPTQKKTPILGVPFLWVGVFLRWVFFRENPTRKSPRFVGVPSLSHTHRSKAKNEKPKPSNKKTRSPNPQKDPPTKNRKPPRIRRPQEAFNEKSRAPRGRVERVARARSLRFDVPVEGRSLGKLPQFFQRILGLAVAQKHVPKMAAC